MKPTITGKKKKGSAAGASSGKGHAPGAGEKRLRETKPAADDDDMFMSVPSFENDGKEFNLGGAGPAWKTYDWQGETSAREKKRARDARAGSERADADAGRSKEKKKPVVNRVKPPRPEKKVKVDMRFGSEADKKKLADERFEERREAKRQKYAALSAAAAERDGDGANEVEPGISGKVLGRRRRAAEKRARAAEKRRADRLERGLPVTRPVKPLPAKLAVGTAAGVSALAKGGDDAGSKNKNAKRKERREKARTARDAEDAKAQVLKPDDATTATREKAEAAGKPNPDRSAKGAPEESAKARARREKREAAEALERRAAALREAAAADSESDSDSEADGSDEDAASPSGGAGEGGEGGDWGEAFSSDEDDGEIDSDEDAALDAALAESDDDDDAEGASPSGEEDSGEEEDPDAFEKARARDPMKRKPSLVDKMRAKLSGGQFRMLNEALYTTTGDEALRMVEDQPGMFSAYHAGFREQTKEWPVRPVDACLKWLATLPKTLRVADFGCGDAELARRAPQKTVHSFDLESEAEDVVACNMANVPLEDASVEVAVFSLSLMGTDYGSFMEEAHRVRARHSTATSRRAGPALFRVFFSPKDFLIPERRERRETRARAVFARPSADDGRVLFTRARTHRRTLPFHRRVITMSPPAGRSPDTFLHPSLRRDAASSERNAD